MNGVGNRRAGCGRGLHVAVAMIALLAMLPLTATNAAAQGATTITLTSFAGDGKTPLPFARFQVTDNSTGTVYGPLETPPGTAKVVFTIALTDPNATFTVKEETPPACGIAPDPLVVGPLVAGDNLNVEFATNFDATCNQGAISAYEYTCPKNFDTSVTDYAGWSQGCTTTVNGATFEFTRVDSGFAFKAVTGAYGIDGRAPYVGLEPGDYTVGEPAAKATPVVFCLTYHSTNAAENPDYDSVKRMDVKNGVVAVSINHNRVACDFFFTQGDQNGNGNTTAGGNASSGGNDTSGAGIGSGSLELHKAQCPAGYTPNDKIFDDCHGNGVAGVTFTIAGPNNFSDSGKTVIEQTPGPGIVRFTGLGAGSYTIGEDVSSDANSIFVYCSLAQSQDQVPFTYNNSGGIDLDLADGANVVCDWYNIPKQQTQGTTLRITKYTCGAGFNAAGAGYGDFQSGCPKTTQGVTFTLAVDGGNPKNKTTNAQGQVVFSKLAPGNYRVTEDVPGDASTPYAFCTVDNGAPFQADLSDGGAYFKLDQSVQLVACDWFNVPADLAANAKVTITKYQCPAGQSSAYADNCTQTISGLTFEATGPQGYDVSNATGTDGKVTFDSLAAGNYVVTETPPDAPQVAVYVVACTKGGNAFDFAYDDSTGLRIKLKVGTHDDIRCNWYNVPPKPTPTAKGSITVNKFLCQGKTNNAYDWQHDCTPYTGGADFNLLTANGKVITSGTTDGNGKLVFTGLADGNYGLDETSANWCHAEADLVDPSGNVLVKDAGNTNVFIYNCTTKQVKTLPSTGVGPLAAGTAVGSGVRALAGGFAGLLMLLALRQRRLVAVRVRR